MDHDRGRGKGKGGGGRTGISFCAILSLLSISLLFPVCAPSPVVRLLLCDMRSPYAESSRNYICA